METTVVCTVLDQLVQKVNAIQRLEQTFAADFPPSLPPDVARKLTVLWSSLDALGPKTLPIQQEEEGEPVSIESCEFFASHCMLDIKGPINPQDICARLEQVNLKGEVSSERKSQDLLPAIMQARVFLAFVSNDYANDSDCCSQFEYAKKVLRLPVIPVAVGQGFEWRKSKLGLLLASDLFIDMTDPSRTDLKFQELRNRLVKLVGTTEAYQAETHQVDSKAPKVGDSFEVLCPASWALNFHKAFSTEKTRFRNGSFTNGANASLKMPYWWPVTIQNVDSDKVTVAYTGYNEPKWQNKTHHMKDLRPIQYASSSAEVSKLAIGAECECRLFQKGGYCWVTATILARQADGKILVRVAPEEGTDNDVDCVEVSSTQLRIFDNSAVQPSAVAATLAGTPSFFISYCWRNSEGARRNGDIKAVAGTVDPRAVQARLKSRSLFGWLDIEQLGTSGLFDDLCSGLCKSKAVVAFISDDYANSENCNLEFTFAAKVLCLPIIPVVVGEGSKWRQSQLSFLLGGLPVVDMIGEVEGSPSFEAKIEEIVARLEPLVGTSATSCSYKASVAKVDADNPKSGDKFEVLCPGSWALNFNKAFSTEQTRFRNGCFTNGADASLKMPYWWPVTIQNVDGDEVTVAYTGYNEPKWQNKTHHMKDLRPIQYASSSAEVSKLAIGAECECRLFQKGGYCWVTATILARQADGKILVRVAPEEGNEEDIDRVVVMPSQIRDHETS